MRFLRNRLVREVAVAVAVCAIAIHALLMAGTGMPAAAESGPICGVAILDQHSGNDPLAPSHMTDCALCGLGHSAAVPPPDVAVAILLPVAGLSVRPADALDDNAGLFVLGALRARAPPRVA